MNSDITISYAFLACNEVKEIVKSLEIISKVKHPNDEIVVLLDKDNYKEELLGHLACFTNNVYYNSLNSNFANQKNELIKKCSKEYILNLDADEYIQENDLKLLYAILEKNPGIDLFNFPRINTVKGITQNHLNAWGWNISKNENLTETLDLRESYDFNIKEYIKLLESYNYIISKSKDEIYYHMPVINYPDYQGRLWKNNDRIKWYGNVHERLRGYFKVSNIPVHIMHHKNIRKQEFQNKFYEEI